MDIQVIPSIITSISAFAIGMFVQFRRSKKDDSSIIAKNYQNIYEELRRDVNRLRDEQGEVRKQWETERNSLNEKIYNLQLEQASTIKELHTKNIEVVRLRGVVNTLEEKLKKTQKGKA